MLGNVGGGRREARGPLAFQNTARPVLLTAPAMQDSLFQAFNYWRLAVFFSAEILSLV